MVIGSDDFSRAVAVVDKVIEKLGKPRRPSVGAMIETPAALFALEEIMDLADFVSIGTNDLTQFILATDRAAADLTDECSPWHPAVLRAIKQVVDAAAVKDRPVCVCGEEAGEAEFACLLVGLGIRELSMTPRRAALVRHALRDLNCGKAQEIARQALRCTTPKQVRELFALTQPAETVEAHATSDLAGRD
jgi:phosphoenolpyruvate-protein kinase (PTS system EI component)